MSDSVSTFLDPIRLLVDLQQVSEIVQSLGGWFEPEAIAQQTTDRLIEKFDCVFARIWLVEPDCQFLKLVASSGLYTHTNGAFAKVPIGAFKVGRIAQNRIPFLSNRLADETWVKDRDWAIANQITGFAGYPLLATDRVIGVLAVFSRQALSNEFLEVLQGLCATLAILLENSIHYQQEKQQTQQLSQRSETNSQSLSEKLADLLQPARLSLFGTERLLSHSLQLLLTHTAEVLQPLHCSYCRLNYGVESVSLDAMLSLPELPQPWQDRITSTFGELLFSASCLGGTLQTTGQTTGVHQRIIQIVLTVPYMLPTSLHRLRICCQSSVLQTAFIHLAYQAGLTVSSLPDATVPLLTDDSRRTPESNIVLWVTTTSQPHPKGVTGKVDLSIRSEQLRQAVETVAQGKSWGLDKTPQASPLSDREQEVLLLLTQGLRDRDIAQQLHISERTVKFHLNNVLTKLGSRTRYQALHQAICSGWIPDLPHE